MKTLKQLFDLISIAVDQNGDYSADWFVDFSGHVNKMSIKYFTTGWKSDNPFESIEQKVDEDGIQALYWFLKTRLVNDGRF